ncbi:hypothetical protein CYY_003676 [Polysphondylium violaceum]|uniref:O-methyltransferase family 3 protein n=1 Tax=Polysphondylium violaceum TaxID=133409 RepID=A0A8J4PZC6_9MYCE|nr:hypothetical protein CYY_003676 [Polysphondylium violaceum]
MENFYLNGYHSKVYKVEPINDQSLQYLLDKCLPDFHPAQIELQKETQKHPLSVMQTTGEQTTFFQFLFSLLNAKKVIEIGVFTGYNSLGMALALPEDGTVIGCDVSEEFVSIGRKYWAQAGVDHKIKVEIQEATKTLQQLIDAGQSNTFDFILIDADKQGYVEYYNLSKQLIRPGGIVAIDNVLFFGYIADPNKSDEDDRIRTIRQLNDIVKHDSEVIRVTLPIGDGLTLVKKK